MTRAPSSDSPHSLSSDSPETPNNTLRRRLLRLMMIRVGLITLLLGSTLIIDLFSTNPLEGAAQFAFLFLIIGTYALTIVHALLLKRFPNALKQLAPAQVASDLALSVAVILFTDHLESPFLFLLSLTVVAASTLLSKRSTRLFLAFSVLFVIFLLVQHTIGWGAPPHPVAEHLREHLVSAITHISAICLIGLLSIYLNEQLRSTGQRLRFANRDIASLEAQNRQIIASIRQGLICYRSDFTVIFANQAALRLLDLTEAELCAQPLTEHFPSLANMPASTDWEETRTTKERQRILLLSVSPLAGTEPAHILTLHDQTPFRQMEQQAERSARLAAVGKMAAAIAHEIRNPLAAMSGSIQMIADIAEEGSLEQRLSGIVQRECDRLNTLISDFLRLARPTKPNWQQVDLVPILNDIAFLFRQEASNCELSLILPESLEICCDPDKLNQVFWNLLRNAHDAHASSIVLDARCENNTVTISVTDSGDGIEESELPKIFDPFFSTKATGNGLGLALVHQIVEDHRGHINVTSRPGKTQFTIRLPLDPQSMGVLLSDTELGLRAVATQMPLPQSECQKLTANA